MEQAGNTGREGISVSQNIKPASTWSSGLPENEIVRLILSEAVWLALKSFTIDCVFSESPSIIKSCLMLAE